MNNKKILYLHGMGGHGHDGIYTNLKQEFKNRVFVDESGDNYNVKVFTLDYDFDPEIAQNQIHEMVDKVKPDLIVAISLGAFHSLTIKDIPHVLISPALNAGNVIAAVGREFERNPFKRFMYNLQLQSSPDRQTLTSDPKILKKFQALADLTKQIDHTNTAAYAIYGAYDMYMQMDVVIPDHFRRIFNSDNLNIIPDADHNFSNFNVMEVVMPHIYDILELSTRED